MSNLELLNPKAMDVDSILEWVKNLAVESSETCQRAEDYYNSLKTHHANLATLLSELQEKKNDNSASKDDLVEIVDTIKEVSEAIHNLTKDNSVDSENLESIEERILSTDEGKSAKAQLEAKKEHFKKTYFHHKTRLGLQTQEEVAKITRLDQRYISLIERGEHKPQFKTIKKIADAFGVAVSDFLN